MDPAAQQVRHLPDAILEEIFARLPPKAAHRCRCLSRGWAARLSSDDFIDHHLRLRGMIRLRHVDIMRILVLRSCHYTNDHNNDDDDSPEPEPEPEPEWDVRGEYMDKGYVEVEESYYVERAEMQALLAEEWAKIDFSGITFADSDDEQMKLITVPYGALDPLLRQKLMASFDDDENNKDDQGSSSSDEEIIVVAAPNGGGGFRRKTEEEVEEEIIFFLRTADRNFLKELNTYRMPPGLAQDEHGEDDDDDDEDEDRYYAGGESTKYLGPIDDS